MTQPGNSYQLHIEAALRFWLEEYKALSADIQNRVSLQQGLINLQLLVVAAFIALIGGLARQGVILQFQKELQLCVLILPILFAFFVWRQSDHDTNIID
jgi:hypothetical protein